MKRVLAAMALVVFCAGAAWLWNGGGRDASATHGATVARSTSAAASARASDAQLEAAPSTAMRSGDVDSADIDSAPTRAEVGRTEFDEAAHASDLVVIVVDPTGRPLEGISLQPHPGEMLGAHADVPPAQVSDANGRAVFPVLRTRLVTAYPAWNLLADLPFDPQPRLRLDAAAFAEPSVRFVLPPGGELVARVRELDGAPAPNGSTLRLQLLLPHERNEPDSTGPQWKLPLVDGALRFPWVELGREWELAAWRPKGSEPTRLCARGPHVLGERVECELVFGSDQPVVQFRVLDPEGRPLPRVEIELARPAIFGSLEKTTLTTDADARFVLDGKLNVFAGGGDFTITHRPSDGAALMGRASLPIERVPGWNDGGDIRLEREPLLVAGRVVDAIGAPVEGADVVAGEEPNWFLGESKSVRGRSGAGGAFELRGLWTEERFRVRAHTSDARSPDTEVTQGAIGVVLALSPRYDLSGTLLLDPGIDPGWIRFAREESDGTRSDLRRKPTWGQFAFGARGTPTFDQSDPNRFELEPIEGGVFDFVCSLENAELARIPRLALHADLDLGRIDLRGKISLVEIELVGDGDLAGLAGSYSWWPSGASEHRQGSFSGPLVSIASAQVPIDVELRPNGYRSALLEQVRGRREHRLTAALHVRLVLGTTGTLPAPPYRFDCELYQGETSTSQPNGARWFTAERREIRCLVASPGRHEVRWHLERKLEGESFGGAVGSHVLQEHWSSIDVLDVPGEQMFEVRLDAAALDELARNPPW
ncbi:MAG: carboxypeptidase regulatory-like domain-containing protein [Planctomycetota bacterium]|nr:MAG: carboxypeptidase regulatory-like domain-containing protein [Planctomycetota bacterium]